MSSIKLSPNASGTGIFSIEAPNSNTNRTLTLPDATGTVQVSGNPISGTTGTFTGLVDISAAGAGQIQFPATQNASSDANTLDDYEEGTWTPSLDRSTSPTVTYSSRGGTYTKIGRFVYLSGYINWSSNSGGSGNFTITGLPFFVFNNAGAYPQLLTTDYQGFDFPAGYTGLGGYGNLNTTSVVFVCYGDNVTSTPPSAVNNSGFIYFNLMYQQQ